MFGKARVLRKARGLENVRSRDKKCEMKRKLSLDEIWIVMLVQTTMQRTVSMEVMAVQKITLTFHCPLI